MESNQDDEMIALLEITLNNKPVAASQSLYWYEISKSDNFSNGYLVLDSRSWAPCLWMERGNY